MIIEEVLVEEGVCREPVGRFIVLDASGALPVATCSVTYRSGDERGAILRELLDEVVLAE